MFFDFSELCTLALPLHDWSEVILVGGHYFVISARGGENAVRGGEVSHQEEAMHATENVRIAFL